MNEVEIRRLCADAGLKVAEIQQMDAILVVVPTSLEQLPDFDTLAGLSAHICANSDYKFVTLGIDGVVFGDAALKPHDPQECFE